MIVQAEYIDVSCSVLIFLSDGYFTSPNCTRELLRAVVTGKPIILMLELEEKHGGLRDVHRRPVKAAAIRQAIHGHLQAAASEPCDKRGVSYTNRYAMWELDVEVKEWGYEMPTPTDICNAFFASEPIEWNRNYHAPGHQPVQN